MGDFRNGWIGAGIESVSVITLNRNNMENHEPGG